MPNPVKVSILGSRKGSKASKKCQFNRFSDRFVGRRIRTNCEDKQESVYKGIDLCNRHRRLLQDMDIEKLAEYGKWEEQIEAITTESLR